MKYNIDAMTVKEILAVPEIVKIIEKYYPGITRHPMLFLVKRKTLPEALKMAGNHADPKDIIKMREEVSRL